MATLLKHHALGVSLLLFTVLVFALVQHFMGALTIPVMDQMAAQSRAARSTSPETVDFPARSAPVAPAEVPIPPAPGQFLGEVHVSAGDSPSHPANPSPTDPLRIAFALGAESSVRVTVSADDGAVVATVLDNPSAPPGSGVVEWDGAGTAGAPVPAGRYTLGVAASDDADVYRQSVHELHVYIARPE